MDNIKRFNKCAKHLYKDLLEIYPDESIIVLAQTAFKLFKAYDKTGPCKYYYTELILKYKSEIENKNSSFFIDGKMQFPYFAASTERLIALWKTLDPQSQEAIWDHLNVLLHISNQEYCNDPSLN